MLQQESGKKRHFIIIPIQEGQEQLVVALCKGEKFGFLQIAAVVVQQDKNHLTAHVSDI